MKKILILRAFMIVALFMINGCKMIDMADIANDDIEVFVNKQKFDMKNIEQYKINGAVVVVFFKSINEKDFFRISFDSLTDKKLKYILLHSYKIDVTGNIGEKHISETINEKLNFEPEGYGWPKNTYSASKILFEQIQLPVGKGSKISVIIDVTVISAEKEERKKMEIEYYYKKYKYPVMPT